MTTKGKRAHNSKEMEWLPKELQFLVEAIIPWTTKSKRVHNSSLQKILSYAG